MVQIITLRRQRRWHLATHLRVGIRNRARKALAHVGVVALLVLVVWLMAGRPGV